MAIVRWAIVFFVALGALCGFDVAPLTRQKMARAQSWVCQDGQCRLVSPSQPVFAPPERLAPPSPGMPVERGAAHSAALACRAAIVRICHESSRETSLGTGTLVDKNEKHGLVLTCGHLFEAAGRTVVHFSDGEVFEARLLEALSEHDLAALLIERPATSAARVGESDPRPGEPLVSAGFGPRGQFATVSGRVVGYTRVVGRSGNEVLEMTGASRPGDSGGPVLNELGELVGVQWGSDGRTVEATCLARVRWFLARHSRRFRLDARAVDRPSAPEVALAPIPPSPIEAPAERPPDSAPPRAQSPNPASDASGAARERLAADASQRELERLRQRMRDLETRLAASGVVAAVEPWATAKLMALAASLGAPGWIVAIALWVLKRRLHRQALGPLPPPRSPSASGNVAARSGANNPDGEEPATLHFPEPIVVRKEHRPPPQIVERDREFVEVQVPPVELRALQWGMDELVRRNPGARSIVETIEAYASQFASGLKERRAA